MIARVSLLTEPPTVGTFYSVPTVQYNYGGRVRAWPVFLPKHEDQEHLNFPYPHYHVDPRFVGGRDWKSLGSLGFGNGHDDTAAFAQVQRQPLSRSSGAGTDPHPPAVWRRMRCARSEIPYQFGHMATIQGLAAHFAGHACKKGRAGWICPHKRFPLGSIQPDADGVITCPLHGLRVRANDGVVVGSAQLTPHQRPSA